MSTGNLYRELGALRASVYKQDGKLTVCFFVKRQFTDENDALAVANEVLEAARR